MKTGLVLVVAPLLLAIAGCVTDYSKSEAPNALRIDGAESRIDVAFARGTAQLAAGEAARLDRLVATGVMRPADRVGIATAGPPPLAERRAAALSSALLGYGIVADRLPAAAVAPDHAILEIGRYTVTLPACPNWSRSPNAEYTNDYRSNWGCADAVNLGLMVANPADLVGGRALAPADAAPAALAVKHYLEDRVKPLISGTATPFAAPAGGAGPGGAPETGASQ